MPNIAPIFNHHRIVGDDGMLPSDRMLDWMSQITDLDIIIGTGSPEGVVIARQGREYMDDAGSAGAIKYIKKLADIGGDRSQGWILI